MVLVWTQTSLINISLTGGERQKLLILFTREWTDVKDMN